MKNKERIEKLYAEFDILIANKDYKEAKQLMSIIKELVSIENSINPLAPFGITLSCEDE